MDNMNSNTTSDESALHLASIPDNENEGVGSNRGYEDETIRRSGGTESASRMKY